MKKKKLIITSMIGLSALSAVGLASCGGNKDADTPSDPVTPEVTTYTVTFHTNGGSTVVPVTVNKGESLPTIANPTKDGNTFAGWFTDEACTVAYTMSAAVNSNLDLYAKWTPVVPEVKTTYQTLVEAATAANTLALNETFDTTSSVAEYSETNANTIGVYQKYSTKGTPAEGSEYNVVVQNNTAVLSDNDATKNKDDSNNNGSVKGLIGLGNKMDGSVEGYVSFNMPAAATGWTFLQLYGNDTAKTDSEIFGIRVAGSSDKDASQAAITKGTLFYRIDGSVNTKLATDITLEAEKDYGLYYTINIDTGKITIKLVTNPGANETVTNLLTDVEIPGLSKLSYFQFVSSDKNSNVLSYDNVVVSYKEADLATVKTSLKKNLAAYVTKQNITDGTALATTVAGIVETQSAAIDAATSRELATGAYDSAITQIDAAIFNDAKTAAEAKIAADYPAANYTINEAAYDTAVAKLDTATTKKDIDDLLVELAAIQNDTAAHDGYVASAISALTGLFPAANYTTTAITVGGVTYSNKTEYDAAFASIATGTANLVTKSEINSYIENVKTTLYDLSTDAEILSTAIAAAKTSLNNYLATEIAAIETTHADNYATIQSIKTTGAATLEAITNIANIDAALAEIKADVDAEYQKTQKSIEDYVSDFAAYKATAVEKVKGEYVDNINAITSDSIANASSVAEAAEAYATLTAQVDAIVAGYNLSVAKKEAIDDIVAAFYANYTLLTDNEALGAYTISFTEQKDLINAATTDTIEAVAVEALAVMNGSAFQAAYQIELDNRVDAKVTVESQGTVTKLANLTTETSSGDITSTTTIDGFSLNVGTHTKYKKQNGYYSLFIGNTITFTVQNDGAVFALSYNSNNAQRKVIVENSTNTYNETKYCTGFTSGGSTYTFNGTEYTLEASAKGWLIFTGLKAGEYTVTFDSDKDGDTGVGKGEQKLERLRLFDTASSVNEYDAKIHSITAEFNTEVTSGVTDAGLVKSITATAIYDSNNDGKIDDGTADASKTIAIEDGYSVKVYDSEENLVETITKSGTYTIIVSIADSKYGTYSSEVAITVSVPVVDPTVITAPAAAENLTYTGSALELVTAGVVEGGTIYYSLDGETYATTIPTATNVGEYTVYYKVVGNEGFNNLDPQTISVEITAPEKLVIADDATPDFVSDAIDNGIFKFDVASEEALGTVIYASNSYTEEITIKLVADIDVDAQYPVYMTGNVVIDLNTHTLTFVGEATDNEISIGSATESAKVVIKNGRFNLESTYTSVVTSNIYAINSEVVLDNVNVNSVRTLILPSDGTKLTIKDSIITACTYVVATNASTNDPTYGAPESITVTGSTLVATEYSEGDGDCAAMLVNVNTEVYVADSTLEGGRQSYIARGGSHTLENVTLINTGAYANKTQYLDRNWGSGDEVPTAFIVAGNRSTAYQYPTSITLNGVTFGGDALEMDVPYIYAWQISETNTCTITVTGNVTVDETPVTSATAAKVSLNNGATLTGFTVVEE